MSIPRNSTWPCILVLQMQSHPLHADLASRNPPFSQFHHRQSDPLHFKALHIFLLGFHWSLSHKNRSRELFIEYGLFRSLVLAGVWSLVVDQSRTTQNRTAILPTDHAAPCYGLWNTAIGPVRLTYTAPSEKYAVDVTLKIRLKGGLRKRGWSTKHEWSLAYPRIVHRGKRPRTPPMTLFTGCFYSACIRPCPPKHLRRDFAPKVAAKSLWHPSTPLRYVLNTSNRTLLARKTTEATRNAWGRVQVLFTAQKIC